MAVPCRGAEEWILCHEGGAEIFALASGRNRLCRAGLGPSPVASDGGAERRPHPSVWRLATRSDSDVSAGLGRGQKGLLRDVQCLCVYDACGKEYGRSAICFVCSSDASVNRLVQAARASRYFPKYLPVFSWVNWPSSSTVSWTRATGISGCGVQEDLVNGKACRSLSFWVSADNAYGFFGRGKRRNGEVGRVTHRSTRPRSVRGMIDHNFSLRQCRNSRCHSRIARMPRSSWSHGIGLWEQDTNPRSSSVSTIATGRPCAFWKNRVRSPKRSGAIHGLGCFRTDGEDECCYVAGGAGAMVLRTCRGGRPFGLSVPECSKVSSKLAPEGGSPRRR